MRSFFRLAWKLSIAGVIKAVATASHLRALSAELEALSLQIANRTEGWGEI